MIDQVRSFIVARFQRITRSIAFYPTVLALGFVLLAIFMRSVASAELTRYANEVMPFLIIRDADVSLSILMTLVGGIISLMVFSFSMVMVVLSNATANLTPRLLPRLIENRRNQIVLGLCLGTILYDILVALDYGPSSDTDRPPSLAVALAVVFGIVCMASFVSFIHGVSRNVQVGAVLLDVHGEATAAIEGVLERNLRAGAEAAPPPHDDWVRVTSERAGFFQGVDPGGLRKFADDNDARIVITAQRGAFLLPGDEIARVEPGVGLQVGRPALHSLFGFDMNELTHQYFVHGFERITEVALKALSPGINDPGTALISIDYLKHLFTLTLATHGWEVLPGDAEGGKTRVWLALESWSTLLERTWTSLYNYAKDDAAVVLRMLTALEEIAPRVPAGQEARAEMIIRLTEPLRPRFEELRYARSATGEEADAGQG